MSSTKRTMSPPATCAVSTFSAAFSLRMVRRGLQRLLQRGAVARTRSQDHALAAIRIRSQSIADGLVDLWLLPWAKAGEAHAQTAIARRRGDGGAGSCQPIRAQDPPDEL